MRRLGGREAIAALSSTTTLCGHFLPPFCPSSIPPPPSFSPLSLPSVPSSSSLCAFLPYPLIPTLHLLSLPPFLCPSLPLFLLLFPFPPPSPPPSLPPSIPPSLPLSLFLPLSLLPSLPLPPSLPPSLPQIVLPMDSQSEGSELTKEPFRWDQRLFTVLLRLPGMGGVNNTSTKVEESLSSMCEATGGTFE